MEEESQKVPDEYYEYIQRASDEELLSDEVKEKIPPFSSFPEEFAHEFSKIRTLEMMRRLKNSIQDLDRNTKNYSGKLIDLTILLFFVALIQVFVSVIAIPETWFTKILIIGTVSYVVYYVIRRITEEKDKKRKIN